jgi:hypothetical protein
MAVLMATQEEQAGQVGLELDEHDLEEMEERLVQVEMGVARAVPVEHISTHLQIHKQI